MSETEARLPEGLLIGWYGDDFTGAAAVMEVLTFAGLPSVLFLAPPSAEQLARFPGLRGVGIASTARSQGPGWMRDELPGAFAALRGLDPQILHYKTCSTLDSAPETGSIGCAIEIGADLCAAFRVPVLVAAPQMRRYQCFGHLFAGMEGGVFRLDRHPVMARHPVTPMTESDVARHIALQSDRIDAGCISLEDLASADLRSPAAVPGRIGIVTLDAVDAVSEAQAGRLIWQARGDCPFVAGSQGVEYALIRHWQDEGLIAPQQSAPGIGRAKATIVVSGSVSPVTAAQIRWAAENGFAALEFDASTACRGEAALEAEAARLEALARLALAAGRDPLIHTAAGPDDPAVARFRRACAATGTDPQAANQRIGETLGRLLARLLARSGPPARAVVSGGDTSGHAVRQLGIFALSALAPTIPGAAIFRAHGTGPADGLELALKGGQMGSRDYFGWVRDGGGSR
ncbi:four-carbon acid sugar kinase family protein [Szabonella alba]|uniref:Four-carbon acid sugar kinase family protein n=1 Tax=Szabonella alba TaxID=2804194 RepID=A0A8K0VF76_9RHOB|nr:four-carbon acid sugar kinase family protein [Szabonella alba]MBL4918680.1 four-carbon acid sugar kinase family protein [Szabonella alba]